MIQHHNKYTKNSNQKMCDRIYVYDYVKKAAKKTPGLKTVAELLSDRFKAISKGRAVKTSGY